MTDTLASPAPSCRGHRFLGFFFAFSYHICCVGAYSSVCVWVPVCACDYKSRSANRISVLQAIRAISSHTRQMMVLSAHNTIFFLPRFQHIVLFRKQTFQPILLVIVHGSGRAPVHLGKHMRCTQRNGAKKGRSSETQTPQKEVSMWLAVSFTPVLFFYFWGSQTMTCGLTS